MSALAQTYHFADDDDRMQLPSRRSASAARAAGLLRIVPDTSQTIAVEDLRPAAPDAQHDASAPHRPLDARLLGTVDEPTSLAMIAIWRQLAEAAVTPTSRSRADFAVHAWHVHAARPRMSTMPVGEEAPGAASVQVSPPARAASPQARSVEPAHVRGDEQRVLVETRPVAFPPAFFDVAPVRAVAPAEAREMPQTAVEIPHPSPPSGDVEQLVYGMRLIVHDTPLPPVGSLPYDIVAWTRHAVEESFRSIDLHIDVHGPIIAA